MVRRTFLQMQSGEGNLQFSFKALLVLPAQHIVMNLSIRSYTTL